MASNCASNIKEEVPEVLINYCTIQCLLSGNFITSRFVSLPKHLLIRRSNLLSRIPRFIRKLSKMEYIWVIQNGGLFQLLISEMSHIIVTSLLLFKITHVNLLTLSQSFLFIYLFIFFLLRPLTSREIWISAKNSTKLRQITSLCKSNYA